MQRIELSDTKTLEIHCPFCGKKVWLKFGLEKCEHVLFHASDEGFEFINDKLDFGPDDYPEDMSIDEFTDKIEFPESFKFAIYQPMPGGMGGYIGFSAKD